MNKAKLMAKVYNHVEGDNGETFLLVATVKSIQIMLVIAA